MLAITRRLAFLSLAVLGGVGQAPPLAAQGHDPSSFQEMRWRMIGPFRAHGPVLRDAGARRRSSPAASRSMLSPP